MSEPVTKAVAQEQPEQKIKTRTSVKRVAVIAGVATSAAVFALITVEVVYAQDKYSLKSPGEIAFSDFRGYEDWSVVSSARTDEVLKVIVGSAAMIEAFKAGVPGTGQPFPEGSRIVKIQWKPKKARRHLLWWTCQTTSRKFSSWKRTVRDFRKMPCIQRAVT